MDVNRDIHTLWLITNVVNQLDYNLMWYNTVTGLSSYPQISKYMKCGYLALEYNLTCMSRGFCSFYSILNQLNLQPMEDAENPNLILAYIVYCMTAMPSPIPEAMSQPG